MRKARDPNAATSSGASNAATPSGTSSTSGSTASTSSDGIGTDGEPTSILTEWGEAYFNWPTDRTTLARTVDALDTVTKRGTKITFFRLGDDPGLVSLIDALANRTGANVVAPDLNELGGAVVGEYLRW